MSDTPGYADLERLVRYYRTMVDHSTDLISRHDIEGRYLYASSFSRQLLGYEPKELVGRNAYDYCHPEDLRSIIRSHRTILKTDRTCTVAYRIRHRDGRYVWVETTSKVIQVPDGTAREIIATTRDITDRKAIEQRYLESKARLKQSQFIARIGHYVLDVDTGCWTSSEALDEIFGIGSDYIRSVDGWYSLIHPDHREEMAGYFTESVLREHQDFNREYRIVRQSDGAELWVHGLGKLEFSAEGRLVKMFGTIQDITERKKLLEEQRRTAQLAALGTVAAGVAHEINNPIQGIINYATLIEHAPEHKERVVDCARRIIKESQRIADITKNLLYYSKSGDIRMEVSDVRELVEGALALIEIKVRRHGVVIMAEFGEGLAGALVHPQGIQQIVINLVDNAFDAVCAKPMPPADKLISVITHIVPGESSPCLCIEVHDRGCGMSEPVRQRARETFFSTKPASQGTGLGLSIVQDIVTLHNGSLEIDSVEGEFTRVRVRLPVATQS